MAKRGIGSVHGRSRKDTSLRDMVVEEEESEEKEAPQEREAVDPGAVHTRPEPAEEESESGLDDRCSVNYFGALDDIIADIYGKQGAGYRVVQSITQLCESRGIGAPFEEERFERTCRNLSMVQATREIAWLFGLGPEHADLVAKLMIEQLFGPPPPKKEKK